jgi:hypothetical protein
MGNMSASTIFICAICRSSIENESVLAECECGRRVHSDCLKNYSADNSWDKCSGCGGIKRYEFIQEAEPANRRPPDPFVVQAARASWIAPFLFWFLWTGGAINQRLPAFTRIVMLVTALGFLISGPVFAVIALRGMKIHGKNGVFVRVVIGLFVSCLTILTLMIGTLMIYFEVDPFA